MCIRDRRIVCTADDAGGDTCRNQAGGHALDKERKADEAIGGTHQLHNTDLLAAVKDSDFDGVVDDDDGDDGQHRHDAVAGVIDDPLQGREGIGHSQRRIDTGNAIDLQQLGRDALNIIGAVHRDAVVRLSLIHIYTQVAEDGGNISQGQRQLLCIARVMLRRPPILILDEATSSIDTRTEVLVQDAFEELMKGRTSFIVAHRLSTIKNADQILVCLLYTSFVLN